MAGRVNESRLSLRERAFFCGAKDDEMAHVPALIL